MTHQRAVVAVVVPILDHFPDQTVLGGVEIGTSRDSGFSVSQLRQLAASFGAQAVPRCDSSAMGSTSRDSLKLIMLAANGFELQCI